MTSNQVTDLDDFDELIEALKYRPVATMIAQLRAALARYGYHESGCTAGFPVSDHCTCGFSAALAHESIAKP